MLVYYLSSSRCLRKCNFFDYTNAGSWPVSESASASLDRLKAASNMCQDDAHQLKNIFGRDFNKDKNQFEYLTSTSTVVVNRSRAQTNAVEFCSNGKAVGCMLNRLDANNKGKKIRAEMLVSDKTLSRLDCSPC